MENKNEANIYQIIFDQEELDAINDVDLLRKHITTLSMMAIKAKDELKRLREQSSVSREWADRRKIEAGYDTGISFDKVWDTTLRKSKLFDRFLSTHVSSIKITQCTSAAPACWYREKIGECFTVVACLPGRFASVGSGLTTYVCIAKDDGDEIMYGHVACDDCEEIILADVNE